jgi:hypothetical protein
MPRSYFFTITDPVFKELLKKGFPPFPEQRSGSNGLLSYQSVDLGGHGRRWKDVFYQML